MSFHVCEIIGRGKRIGTEDIGAGDEAQWQNTWPQVHPQPHKEKTTY
jgi:hypothetical protein